MSAELANFFKALLVRAIPLAIVLYFLGEWLIAYGQEKGINIDRQLVSIVMVFILFLVMKKPMKEAHEATRKKEEQRKH